MTVGETELLPRYAELIGEFSAASELGLDFPEPTQISYLDAPLSVFRTSTDTCDRFDVLIGHEPFDGDKLRKFLSTAAPSRFMDSINGITGDWEIAYRDARPEDPDDLVTMHKRFDPEAWGEFVASVDSFIKPLQDSEEPGFWEFNRHPGDYTSFRYRPVITDFERDLLRITATHLDDGLSILQIAGYDIRGSVMEEIAHALNVRQNNPKKHIQVNEKTRPELSCRYKAWGMKRRTDVLRHVIRSLGPSVREDLHEQLRGVVYDELVTDSGGTRYYPRPFLADEETLAKGYNERFIVRQGDFEAEVMELEQKDGKVLRYLVPSSTRRFQVSSATSPLLAWERSGDGQRRFIFERSQDTEPTHYRDGVLGAIAVAYFSPDLRANKDIWPESVPIRRSGRGLQELGVAQVPLLALMRRQQLLETDFIEAAESVAV